MMRRQALLTAAMIALLPEAPAAATGQDSGDVVVRASRLRDWRSVLEVGQGDVVTCRTLRSTGDAALDADACAARTRCYDAARPRIVAARTRRALTAVNRDIDRCFADLSTRITGDPPRK
ncbi:hypothetical protein ASE86_14705 [Sphingomonas sp. Leaf33]|uniref:hypothetical protein n=1 Tax=Sphingomonas sp. Leaf33 TaxID=1736215 RepID=UPI0006FF9B0A|nr:hypothetical protein [Sphingomonas sp. Leaf33]KQN21222.1 hypothetical protein ASE86_14705 [Sphingomonas sp. Leaf33]